MKDYCDLVFYDLSMIGNNQIVWNTKINHKDGKRYFLLAFAFSA